MVAKKIVSGVGIGGWVLHYDIEKEKEKKRGLLLALPANLLSLRPMNTKTRLGRASPGDGVRAKM
jgi:hypothetical protein